ncbi:MAG TPA: sulfatase-like hydrolase/transferase, partial [Polyangiales bacterium]|nr:sulfatase-like hydrolase/transferase [Polyangiales bacterium]
MPEGPAASAEHRLPTRSGARAVLLAVPLALLTLGLAECLHVPWLVYARAPARCVPIALFVYSRELAVLAPNLAFQLALAALCARAVLRGKSLRAQASACAVLALAPVAFAYAVLIRDPVFIRYPPLYAGLLALLAYLAGSALWLVNDMELPHAPRWLARLRLPWTALAFLAAGAVHAANLRLYVDDYPTLHAAALACTYLLLHAGIALLLATARGGARAGSLSARAWTALAIGTLLPGLLGATLPAIAAVRPFVYAHTLSGRASLVPGREIEPIAPRRVEVPNAEAYFLAHSHLPTLPADFSLARNNVLLITSEATRFDQTSFANPRTGLTPNLRKWQRDAHAFWFSQAYSASCSTGQSMASLLSMTFPSAARWQVWRKRWNGELLPEADSLPEVFARGGYKTFWISHNHRALFG